MRDFNQLDECRKAFEKLKGYLASPPLLSKPKFGETLDIYLAASIDTISSILNREGLQKPIYYTSRILHDAEMRYSRIEKIVFTLITSMRRLRLYFQVYSIIVLLDQPLRALLQCPNTSGKMAKWAIRLTEFDLSYCS